MSSQPTAALPPDALLRRASCLVAVWEGNRLLLENYLTGGRAAATPTANGLLAGLTELVPYQRVIATPGAGAGTVELVDQLVAEDILLVGGTPLEQQDRRIQELWTWGHSARYLHYQTRRARFFTNPQEEAAGLAALTQRRPAPPPFGDRGDAGILLPGGFNTPYGGLWELLLRRRTRRDFARVPVSLEELAAVLLWTWGKTHVLHHPVVGPIVLKTSPSGGARHPTEVYPVALRVAGLEPGIYHYSVQWHALELVRAGAGMFEELVVAMCAQQRWVRDAAVVLILTAQIERSMWKYPHAHAYRVLLLDAGHLGQTFQLVCTALGLAPFTSAAMDDELVERELGLDGVAEVPVYAAAFGRPAAPG
jgi:SagB-type dehydrogenase family enzyme